MTINSIKIFQRTTKGNKVHVRACIILIIYLLKNDSDNLGKIKYDKTTHEKYIIY